MIGRRTFSFLRGRTSRPSRNDGGRSIRFLSDEELVASLNQAVLENALKLINSGADVELILLFLTNKGFDMGDSVIAMMALMGQSHNKAKELVFTSKSWTDRFDSVKDLHEKAHKALMELAASEEINLVEFDEKES